MPARQLQWAVVVPTFVAGSWMLAGETWRTPGVALIAVVIAVSVLCGIERRRRARIARMVGFADSIREGELVERLSRVAGDDLGALEEALTSMHESLSRRVRESRQESEQVGGVLRAMTDGVVVLDPHGDVMVMNARAQEYFELAQGSDYRGRQVIEMNRDPALLRLVRSSLRSDGSPDSCEVTVGGHPERHLIVTGAPLGPADGAPAGAVLVFHDVTELKRLETMRRDFVANVSHEIRTPLTAIRGYAETLLEGALDDRQRAQQFVEVIDRHSRRLSRLIDDLLALSDLEFGKIPLRTVPLALVSLAQEVAEVLEEPARQAGIELVNAISADLPPVLGDADRLQQVLINLVDNAVKFSARGGRVDVGARLLAGGEGAPHVEVVVTDQGIGIPAADLPRLTERFYRVDKARSRELGGTGLGLAIVKHIVQSHGGQISITSQVGKGTTVRFSLPSAPRDAD